MSEITTEADAKDGVPTVVAEIEIPTVSSPSIILSVAVSRTTVAHICPAGMTTCKPAPMKVSKSACVTPGEGLRVSAKKEQK